MGEGFCKSGFEHPTRPRALPIAGRSPEAAGERDWRPPPKKLLPVARRSERDNRGQHFNRVTADPCPSDRGTCWVLPLTYFYLPKSSKGVLFPQSVSNHYFCSGPTSADPICPQPRRLRRLPAPLPRYPASCRRLRSRAPSLSRPLLFFQGEPLVEHYLSNPGLLQKWRILWRMMVVLVTISSASNK